MTIQEVEDYFLKKKEFKWTEETAISFFNEIKWHYDKTKYKFTSCAPLNEAFGYSGGFGLGYEIKIDDGGKTYGNMIIIGESMARHDALCRIVKSLSGCSHIDNPVVSAASYFG